MYPHPVQQIKKIKKKERKKKKYLAKSTEIDQPKKYLMFSVILG
jgi:hypothetical protein